MDPLKVEQALKMYRYFLNRHQELYSRSGDAARNHAYTDMQMCFTFTQREREAIYKAIEVPVKILFGLVVFVYNTGILI